MKRPYLTGHAADRWRERFEGDIWAAFDRAVPFGGQRRGDRSLLDAETGAVFIVTADNAIRTVLTKEQSYVNIQAYGSGKTFHLSFQPEPPKRKSQKEVDRELSELAKTHIKIYGFKIGKGARKKINQALFERGMALNSRDWTKYYEFLHKYVNEESRKVFGESPK